MSPALTQNELSDGIMAETKFSTKSRLALASGMPGSYFEDDFLGDDFSVAPNPQRMSDIGLGATPFQVSPDVIAPDEIKMIDHGKVVGIWDEDQGNKAVNAIVFSCKENAPVSILIGLRKQNLSDLALTDNVPQPHKLNKTVKTSNPSNTGHLVSPLMAGDITPFFYHGHLSIPCLGAGQYKEQYKCL